MIIYLKSTFFVVLIRSVHRSHLSLLSSTMPRYLQFVTDCIGSPLMKVGLKDCRFLKLMDISFVLVLFMRRLNFSHEFKKWSRTGPYSSPPSYRRLTKAVLTAYLIKCLLGKVLGQELVYKINNKGDKTQSWGKPVRVIILSESEVTTLTCWVLQLRKSTIHKIKPASRENSVR